MRLIDADAPELYDKAYCPSDNAGVEDHPLMIEWADIDSAPTIDAVPVVRCRNCKYWQDNNGGYPHIECRWGKDETPDPDDFCSYGERKGD